MTVVAVDYLDSFRLANTWNGVRSHNVANAPSLCMKTVSVHLFTGDIQTVCLNTVACCPFGTICHNHATFPNISIYFGGYSITRAARTDGQIYKTS